MSGRVEGKSPSLTEVNFNEVESEPITVPARIQSQPQGSQVESWSGQQPTMAFPAAERGPLLSGQDLAAQFAREAAERQAALKSLGGLEDPLTKLAKKYPDPIGFHGYTAFKNKDVSLSGFGDAIHHKNFESAVSTLSASDVRASVEAQVKKAWPNATPEQTEKLKAYFMGEICESLRERAAPKLQALATKMLEDAAGQFSKAASDPAQLQQLAKRLTDMAHPLADPGDQAIVRDLRAGLGLDPDQAVVTPDRLAVVLGQRAALLEEEAKKMELHDRPTLFRALAKQDVSSSFKQAAGIREGSLLAAQIDAVKVQGEAEQDRITYAKCASAFVAGGFSAGMWLGGAAIGHTALGVAVGSTAIATPTVSTAWEEVGTAKAGESAGTMKAGAGEEARTHAIVETVMAGVAVGGGAVVGSTLHVAGPPLAQIVVHGGAELAVEYASHKAGHAINDALTARAQASGKSALERLKP